MAESSGFIYGNFRPFVDKQIKTRQNVLSLEERGPENILYLNGKTSWVKMTSAVNITENSYVGKQYPNLLGDGLAKSYQLLGGTLWRNNNKDSIRDRFGVSSNINNSINYGLGGHLEAGFRPMPGITSVEIKNPSTSFVGSLREATIKFQCFTLTQLEVLECLYMRLGYQILLEWGHTIYYKGNFNGENYQLNTGKDISYIDFFKTGLTQKDVLTQIELKKLDSQGNYDAILGVVKNFTWEAISDGSYECTVNLVTWGEMVESLKVNSSSPNVKINTDVSLDNNIKSDLDTVLAFFSNPDTSNQSIKDLAIPLISLEGYSYYSLGPNDDVGVYKVLTDEERKIIYQLYEIPFTIDANQLTFKYIPLAMLLNVLRNLCLIKNQKGENLLNINLSVNNTFALSNEYQISIDPSICLFPSIALEDNTGVPGFNNTNPNYTKEYVYGTDYPHSPFNPRVNGTTDLMNPLKIAINLEFIKDVIKQTTNSESGEIILIDFIRKILNGINSATGNINEYNIVIDNNSNTLSIVDLQMLPLRLNSPSIINVSQDVKKKKSFVRNYSFSSRVTSKLGSAIAISAQANSKDINFSNLALSKLNAGLIDRITSDKTVFYQNTKDDSGNIINTIIKINYLSSYVQNNVRPRNYSQTEIENIRNILPETLKSILNLQGSVSPFIPIDINLEIDGLSGIRVGECFLIEENKLPKSYKTLNGNPIIKFLVMEVSHKINGNNWITSIRGLSVEYNPIIRGILTQDEAQQTLPLPPPIQPTPTPIQQDTGSILVPVSIPTGSAVTSTPSTIPNGYEIQQPDATRTFPNRPIQWVRKSGGTTGGSGAGGNF